jgi:hypothetical protein
MYRAEAPGLVGERGWRLAAAAAATVTVPVGGVRRLLMRDG